MILALLAAAAIADTCSAYGPHETVATASGGPVTESSGVAASRTRDGVIFTHDDKGGEPVLYAYDLQGALLDEHLVRNATNEDWEDLAAAPCPDVGDCLYVGDIGNNDGARQDVTVYVVREPEAGDARVKAIARWTGVYPGGETHDAEALMVHPCTGRVHVVTKSGDGRAQVFRFPADPDDGVAELEQVATVVVEGLHEDSRTVTGGDWDLDGDRVALRTSDQVLEWVSDPAAPNDHWGSAPTVVGGLAEAQGEAVGYGLGGELITTTEGDFAIGVIPCEAVQPSDHVCDFPQTGRVCGCAQAPAPAAAAVLPLLLLVRRRRAGCAQGAPSPRGN